VNPLAWDAPKLVVYAALFVIVTCRATGTYWVGRGVVSGIGHSRFKRILADSRYRRAADIVARYGAPAVALCFVTVGFQTMVLVAAGVARMPAPRFVPAVAVGGVAWALIYGTVGFVGLELWLAVYRLSPSLTIVGSLALAAAAALFVLVQHRVRRRSPHAPATAADDHSADAA